MQTPAPQPFTPVDVATKAQGWAHPLQGQIQGSHWVAGSERYLLISRGTSQGSLRMRPWREKFWELSEFSISQAGNDLVTILPPPPM